MRPSAKGAEELESAEQGSERSRRERGEQRGKRNALIERNEDVGKSSSSSTTTTTAAADSSRLLAIAVELVLQPPQDLLGLLVRVVRGVLGGFGLFQELLRGDRGSASDLLASTLLASAERNAIYRPGLLEFAL